MLDFLQATARRLLGTNSTAFTQITDGNTTVEQGELVSLAVKPAMIGRIMYFSIAQVGPWTPTPSCRHGHSDCQIQMTECVESYGDGIRSSIWFRALLKCCQWQAMQLHLAAQLS